MKLYLDKKQAEYLEQLLKRENWWLPKLILKRLNKQRLLEEWKERCNHTYQQYVGQKTGCSQCPAIQPETTNSWKRKQADE